MALPLIPFAFGLAAGAAATYLYKDEEARAKTTRMANDTAKAAGFAVGAIKGFWTRKPREGKVIQLSSERERKETEFKEPEPPPEETHGPE